MALSSVGRRCVILLALVGACSSRPATSKGGSGGAVPSGGSGAGGTTALGGAGGTTGPAPAGGSDGHVVTATGGSDAGGGGGLSAPADGGTAGRGTAGSSAGGNGPGLGGAAGLGGGGGDWDPFGSVVRQPDVDTSPVANCAGQPDLTLCNVVTNPDRWYDVCVQGVCVSPGCGDTSCNVPAPHFHIPANDGHKHLLLVNGPEPTVADLVTGLEWQGCSAGLTGDGCAAGTEQEMTWTDALAYCDGLTWGGKTDWYLPDAYELMSLLDWNAANQDSVGNPLNIDRTAFPHAADEYWSSHFSSASQVFGVQYGATTPVIVSDRPQSGTYRVRCVRRGASGPSGYTGTRFVRSGTQPIIQDPATGLSWQGCLTGRLGPGCGDSGSHDPTPATVFAYCDALSWAGFTDWRVPTYKELASVLQYPPLSGGSNPALSGPFAIEQAGAYLFVAKSWRPDATMLLMQATGGNAVFPDASSDNNPVLCVRGP